MKTLQRLASETFVIGWQDALLMLVSGAGLGVIATLMVTSLLS